MKSLPVSETWQGYSGRLALPGSGGEDILFAGSQSPVQLWPWSVCLLTTALCLHKFVRRDEGSAQRGWVWFSRRVGILTLPVCFPGGPAQLSLVAPNQAARWALSNCGARGESALLPLRAART